MRIRKGMDSNTSHKIPEMKPENPGLSARNAPQHDEESGPMGLINIRKCNDFPSHISLGERSEFAQQIPGEGEVDKAFAFYPYADVPRRHIGDGAIYLPPFHLDRRRGEQALRSERRYAFRAGITKWIEGLAGLLILFGGIYGALLLFYGVAS